MSDDRRYKQRGYQDPEGRSGGGPRQPGFSPGTPRIPVITQYKETVRCAECGHEIGTLFEILGDSVCPRCSTDLHTCRNCKHFDTSKRFECSQTIPKRAPTKGSANTCELFTPRTIVVKELNEAAGVSGSGPTPGPPPVSSSEARAALEKLFKK